MTAEPTSGPTEQPTLAPTPAPTEIIQPTPVPPPTVEPPAQEGPQGVTTLFLLLGIGAITLVGGLSLLRDRSAKD
jgi:hypothetical protein